MVLNWVRLGIILKSFPRLHGQSPISGLRIRVLESETQNPHCCEVWRCNPMIGLELRTIPSPEIVDLPSGTFANVGVSRGWVSCGRFEKQGRVGKAGL